jgi:hypothetical protein
VVQVVVAPPLVRLIYPILQQVQALHPETQVEPEVSTTPPTAAVAVVVLQLQEVLLVAP